VKIKAVVLLGVVFLMQAGCSSVSTHYDYDTQADFSKLKTFAWMPRETTGAGGNAQQAQADNSLFDKRLKAAVNNNLETKGYTIDTTEPDFVIIYHTGVQDKVNVTNWGYTYGPYWGPWGESVDVTQYTEGTLILDFVDYVTKSIVWRGTAQKALSGNVKPEDAEKNLQNAVDQLLAKFPPQ
jgi:hypothetical protein